MIHDDLLDTAAIHVPDNLANAYRFLHGYLSDIDGMTDALTTEIGRTISEIYGPAEPKRI